jgi:hypothetical protein
VQGQRLNTTNDMQAPPDLLSISHSTRVEESQGHTLGPSRLGRQPRQVHDYVLSGNGCAVDEKKNLNEENRPVQVYPYALTNSEMRD